MGLVDAGVGSPAGGAATALAAGTLSSERTVAACTVAGFVTSGGESSAATGAITGGTRVTVTVTVTGAVASVAGGGVVAVTVTGGVVVVALMDSQCLGWS